MSTPREAAQALARAMAAAYTQERKTVTKAKNPVDAALDAIVDSVYDIEDREGAATATRVVGALKEALTHRRYKLAGESSVRIKAAGSAPSGASGLEAAYQAARQQHGDEQIGDLLSAVAALDAKALTDLLGTLPELKDGKTLGGKLRDSDGDTTMATIAAKAVREGVEEGQRIGTALLFGPGLSKLKGLL